MKLLGVSSWRGWAVTFSDGMCTDCAARARVEWNLPPARSAASGAGASRPGWRSFRPDFALATVVLVTAVAVSFGVMMGPPAPRAVSEPVFEGAGPEAVASLEGTGSWPDGTLAPGTAARPSITPVPSERAGGPPLASPGSDSAGAQVASDGAGSPPHASPVRVARARAKRVTAASYQPVRLVFPTLPMDLVEPTAVSAEPAPTRWLVAMVFVEVQAP